MTTSAEVTDMLYKVRTLKLNAYEIMMISNALEDIITEVRLSGDEEKLDHLGDWQKLRKKFDFSTDLFPSTEEEYQEALEYEQNGR